MEGAAYCLILSKDAEIEERLEWLIDKIENGISGEGYFNSYYLIKCRSRRFQNRDHHELYCAGHLIEAAVAYYEATGKIRFLDLMQKYAEYIYDVFYVKKTSGFETPGHEEIELALVRLWQVTGNEKWLNLAAHFVERRGRNEEDKKCFEKMFDKGYGQDQSPVEEQTEPLGHVVRFMYLYTAVADLARETGNKKYADLCLRMWEEVVSKKMYVTGGVGNMSYGEAFGPAYFLPNFEAYTETCASIGMAYWAHRMLQMNADSRYADVLELQMYNGALAGVSFDGEHFFYENPLQARATDQRFLSERKACNRPVHRVKVFSCSCCPPNILRFVASIGSYMYTQTENTLFVHQYIQSDAEINLGGQKIIVEQITDYPYSGKVEIIIYTSNVFDGTIAVRIPGWCDKAEIDRTCVKERGYWYVKGIWKDKDRIVLNMPMEVQELEANPMVAQDTGKIALRKGPVIYCIESADNSGSIFDITISDKPDYRVCRREELLGGIDTIEFEAFRRKPFTGLYQTKKSEYEKITVTAIPYHLWGNRSEGDMEVWINKALSF